MEVQDATKVRLLEAAGRGVCREGLRMRRGSRTICGSGAQANIAAVNYHFGDKEQLYVQAVLDAHRCGFESEERDEGQMRRSSPRSSFAPSHPSLPGPRAGGPRPGRLAASAGDPGDVASHECLGRLDPRVDPAAIRAAGGDPPAILPGGEDERTRCMPGLQRDQPGDSHYKMARSVAERLIGPGRGWRRLDHAEYPDGPHHDILPGGPGRGAPPQCGGARRERCRD